MLFVKDVVALPIAQFREFIQDVVSDAKQEFHLREQIQEIRNYWRHENIHMVHNQNDTVCMFGPGVEQSLIKIDEHMKILEECDTDSLHLETAALSRKLASYKTTMKDWLAAQEFWQYLQKIHSRKNNQNESFDALNRQWVELMSGIMKTGNLRQS